MWVYLLKAKNKKLQNNLNNNLVEYDMAVIAFILHASVALAGGCFLA
jgi:hypothetical protein